jgi:hypothetical protein
MTPISDSKALALVPKSQSYGKDVSGDSIKNVSASISSQDIEKAPTRILECLSMDPNLVSIPCSNVQKSMLIVKVTWTSLEDSRNPKNWPNSSKWLVTSIVSLFLLLTIMCSTIISPALPAIGVDLGIDNDAELQTTMSIYVLGYAFGPLFLAPLSELYGRVIILQLSNVYFVIWSVVCGFANTKTQMIVARFMAGIGSSAALAVSCPYRSSVSNC